MTRYTHQRIIKMKKKYLISSIALLLWSCSEVAATPTNVIIIRHAEKIPGEKHLSPKGYERAGALPYYFEGTPLYNNPPIAHVFAAGVSDLEKSYESIRPIETCTPTADYLRLSLNVDFKPHQEADFAKELLTNPKYNNSTVLVCWPHQYIGDMVQALGAGDPGKWSKEIFDQVYLLTFEQGSTKPKLQKILQKLMFEDRPTFDAAPPPLPPRHVEK
jgi:hypothetical protein